MAQHACARVCDRSRSVAWGCLAAHAGGVGHERFAARQLHDCAPGTGSVGPVGLAFASRPWRSPRQPTATQRGFLLLREGAVGFWGPFSSCRAQSLCGGFFGRRQCAQCVICHFFSTLCPAAVSVGWYSNTAQTRPHVVHVSAYGNKPQKTSVVR